GIHLAETLVALERRALSRLLERDAPEIVDVLHRRLGIVLVEDDRRALGDRAHLLPVLEQARVVRRLEQFRTERDGRRPRDDDSVAVGALTRTNLDAVAVDRRRRRHDRLADLGVADTALVAAEFLPEKLGQDA